MINSLRVVWRTRLAALLLVCAATGAAAPREGKPVPEFEITMLDGKVFKSSEAKGEVIVVNLWATWCTYCREEMPALETYYRRHRVDGLRLIAVSMDDDADDDKMRKVMHAYSYPGGIARLSSLKGFGRIWRLPMTFVIDRNGILRRDGSEGDPKVDLAALERIVTPLLNAGKTPR
jgi:thiol-disulfide isomerase/thioredoxin